MNGSKHNFYCEECNFEDGDGGDCPRCGNMMQDISGKEYMQSNADSELENENFDMNDDFDFAGIGEDEFEEVV